MTGIKAFLFSILLLSAPITVSVPKSKQTMPVTIVHVKDGRRSVFYACGDSGFVNVSEVMVYMWLNFFR